MAGNKDFIDILREIRGTGIPGEAYSDGIWYELTIADKDSNPGIYGDILSKYGIIKESVDTFDQAVAILEKLNVEVTTLPAGTEATSALVNGVWQLGIPRGAAGIDAEVVFTPDVAINYSLGNLNYTVKIDGVQVTNDTLVNLDNLVNTVVNANIDVQTTLEAKQLIIDSVEIVQEIADGLDDNVANKIIELSNHTIAKLDELNAASTAEQLEITNTANVEKLAFGQSVITKVTQYNENHVAKLAEYDANDELKIEQYNTNHTERLENLDEKYATRIIDMLNTNKILGMVDKFAATVPTQYATFLDTVLGPYIYYLNGTILTEAVDYTVVNITTIQMTTALGYGDIVTQVDSQYIGDYLTFEGVILEERIGQPEGVAGLDESGKVPAAQLPSLAYEPKNTNIQAHVASTSNPHGVTAAQVGLSNVNNTSDVTKNVLSATKWTNGRTITIGSTGKSVDGSGNVSWSLAEIGAQAAGSYQPLDDTLTALAGVTTAADKVIYATGADTFATTTISSFARTVLDDADAATVRATIGAQALDADLTAIAALAGTSGLLKKTAADTWTLDTAAYTTNLGTVTGVTGTAPVVSSGGTAPAISINAATTSTAGSMSAADKTKLDGIATSANNYVHPTTDGSLHVPATGTANSGKVLTAGATAGSLNWTTVSSGTTDHTLLSNIGTNTHTQIDTALTRLVGTSGTNTGDQTTITGNAATATKLVTARTINGVSFDGTANIVINAVDSTSRIASSEKGVANGVATLDASGMLFTNQLPSYVDDVLEYTNLAGFPATGEAGKIYVALDTNKTYRWGGSSYTYITSGAVDSVAGKTGVVSLVKADVGLSNVDNTADVSKNVLYSTTAGAVTGQGALATLSSVNASTITDNSVGAAELNVTGNGTTSQYLRSDGDGTFTWATPTDTNTTYTAGTGLSLTGTVFANTSPNVSTNLTYTTATTTGSVNSSDGTNATIPAATTSLAGLMTNADKSKLDGVATGANNYAHPTGDGNLHVPANGTTNNGKFLMAGATAGSLSWETPVTNSDTAVNLSGGYVNATTGSFSNDVTFSGDMKKNGNIIVPMYIQSTEPTAAVGETILWLETASNGRFSFWIKKG